MARVFPPYTNTLARAGLFGVFAGPVVAFLVLTGINWSPYVTEVGVPRDQPVPFSHQHHVAGLGLDCRYCHTTVEDSSFANIPPVHTCMTCHSQIWKDAPVLEPIRESYRTGVPVQWTRVYDLPDFVYFNHSIHVNKGIGCVTCHGPIDQMPMTRRANPLWMSWCLNCHRHPEQFVRPREAVFDMNWHPKDQSALGKRLVAAYHIRHLTDCYTCHR
ncbi:MAG TPA: cytochrome c3 family protein [Chthonomonadaceae bacterium]|nr:cytochrome c3 family protein [Chthonomonadaceae bacterium]